MEKAVRDLRAVEFTLFVYTIMGWGWGVFLLDNLKGVPFFLALLAPLIVALPLLIFVLLFARKMHGLAGPRLFANARVVWLYVAAWTVTLGGYVLANVLAHTFHHLEWVVPGGTLALGLHFLFISLAFQTRRAYLTLAIFCLAALLVPLFVPMQFTLGSLTTLDNGGGWMVVTSVIGMIWLWLFALFLLVTQGKHVEEIRHKQTQKRQVASQAAS